MRKIHFSITTSKPPSLHIAGMLLLFLLMSFFSTNLFAQQQGKPTWSGQSPFPKTGDDYQPKEIKDIFAKEAVTYEEMAIRAKYFPYMPKEIVVAIQLETTKARALETIKAIQWQKYFAGKNVTLLRRLLTVERTPGRSVSLVHLSLPDGFDVLEAMKVVWNQQGVLWSSPNFVYNGDPRDIVPNDTRYADQYHHPLMKNNLAWDINQGSSSVIIAVTDDGVERTHSDLSANIWVNTGEIAGDGIDNDANGYIDDVNGWDFDNNNNNPNPNVPGDSHGTHVSGCAAARINNSNGVAGVAGLSTIMPIQFYGEGGANWTAALINESFVYSVDNGAQIVNTSYAIDGFATDPVFIAGVQYVLDAGSLHFNSAGNNNELNPARQAVTHTILVASTTSTDQRSSFSNYGTGVDVSAPGTNILSSVVGNAYDYYSGTSMSTPNAAGSAALIWSAHPTWTNYQVAAQLLATADDIYPLNPTLTGYLGSGRINNYAALTTTLPAPKVSDLTGLPAEGTGAQAAGIANFTVSFNQVMDPATVNNINNFELRSAGVNGTFDDGDDVLLTLTATTVYRVGTNDMAFQITQVPLACGNYRFKMTSGGLRNPFATALDGDGNGTGGDNFVRNFSIGTLLFTDADGDGYGTGTATVQPLCAPGPGFSITGGDCNDANNNINPGETEICNNGLDDNCDGLLDYVPAALTAPLTFTNSTSIAVPGTGTGASTGAPANPYPSTIAVTGVTGTLGKIIVKLNSFQHTYPDDVDILLVSPTGQKMRIFSDIGGNTAVTGINLVLDDAATSSLSTSTLASGTFKPTNDGATDAFPAPAPAGPHQSPAPAGTATFASVFGGQLPNGTWSLYAVDDAGGDAGSLLGGWELIISGVSNLCDQALPEPTLTVTQPTCLLPTGSIVVDSPNGIGYTYSIGAAYQEDNEFPNLSPGFYSVTAMNANGVVSPALSVTLNAASLVVPATPGLVQGLTNVCPYVGTSTQLTYSVVAVAGATSYNWVVPPTVTLISGQGTNSINVTINSNFLSNVNRLFKVTASSDCGTSAERQFWLLAQFPGTPQSIIASGTNVCAVVGSAVPIVYTIPKVTSATSYIWTTQAGTTTISHLNGLGINDTTVAVTFSSGFTTSVITVQSLNECGSGGIRSFTIVRNIPGTPGLISGPTSVCEFMAPGGTAASYSVPLVAHATTYTWSIPPGSTGLTGQGTNSISFTYPSGFLNGVLSVTASNGCGASAARTLAVRKLTPSAPGVIDVIQTGACPNRTYSYTIAAMPANATSILWTAPPGGSIISGSGTTSIVVSYGSGAISGSVSATAQSNCGSSSTRYSTVKLPVCPLTFTKGNVDAGILPDLNNKFTVQIYPNPAINNFNVQVSSKATGAVTMRILDLQGREVKRQVFGVNTMQLLGSELKAGAYLIELTQGNNRRVEKLIKL